VTPWWNQEVKDGIRAKTVACKAWHQKKADTLHLRQWQIQAFGGRSRKGDAKESSPV